MERTAWTDERLDDLSRRIDAGFNRVDADVRELRIEMRGGFDETHRQFGGRFDETNAQVGARFDETNARFNARFDETNARFNETNAQVGARFDETNRRIDSLGSELRGEIEGLRITILRVGGGMMVGLVGVIAAVLARGV